MSSFGHYVRLLTDDERADLRKMTERYGPRFYTCQNGRKPNRCEREALYWCGYKYVTGRAGRVSSAEKHRCEEHARKFADKHGLEMPTASAPRPMRTGGDIVADVLAGTPATASGGIPGQTGAVGPAGQMGRSGPFGNDGIGVPGARIFGFKFPADPAAGSTPRKGG